MDAETRFKNGRKGGQMRAKNLTASRRKAIASKAAVSRWALWRAKQRLEKAAS